MLHYSARWLPVWRQTQFGDQPTALRSRDLDRGCPGASSLDQVQGGLDSVSVGLLRSQ